MLVSIVASSEGEEKSNSANGFVPFTLRTVDRNADGSDQEGNLTVRTNPLKILEKTVRTIRTQIYLNLDPQKPVLGAGYPIMSAAEALRMAQAAGIKSLQSYN